MVGAFQRAALLFCDYADESTDRLPEACIKNFMVQSRLVLLSSLRITSRNSFSFDRVSV